MSEILPANHISTGVYFTNKQRFKHAYPFLLIYDRHQTTISLILKCHDWFIFVLHALLLAQIHVQKNGSIE